VPLCAVEHRPYRNSIVQFHHSLLVHSMQCQNDEWTEGLTECWITTIVVTSKGGCKNGSHNFGRTRSYVKSLDVVNQKLEGNKTSNFVSTPKPAVKKKYFKCGSVSHLICNCPEKPRSSEIPAKQPSVNSAEVQVNRCQVDSEHVIAAAGLGPGPQTA